MESTRTGRAIGLALGIAGIFVGIGLVDGVFARLGVEWAVALAAFGLGFALATFWLDAEVRAWVLARRALRRWAAGSPAARPDARAAPRTSARGSDGARARSAG